ncbi:hypothetical protein GW17_00022213 [Ensete ventricosum]|nr:hypothetical protein GW17_00022213 [Ensete ventricosum]
MVPPIPSGTYRMIPPIPSGTYRSASRLLRRPPATGQYYRLGFFSPCYRPLGQYQLGCNLAAVREKEEEGEEGEEKGEPGDLLPLSLNDPDP